MVLEVSPFWPRHPLSLARQAMLSPLLAFLPLFPAIIILKSYSRPKGLLKKTKLKGTFRASGQCFLAWAVDYRWQQRFQRSADRCQEAEGPMQGLPSLVLCPPDGVQETPQPCAGACPTWLWLCAPFLTKGIALADHAIQLGFCKTLVLIVLSYDCALIMPNNIGVLCCIFTLNKLK